MTSKEYLGEFIEHVSGLFSESRKAGKGQHDREPPPAAAAIQGRTGMPKFEERVRGLLAYSAEGAGGRVHFIGLSDVRAHYGNRWPSMAEKTHHIAREAIKRRLTKQDLFTGYKDEGYILVFSRLEEEAAQMKCGLIAQEIGKRLFGENDFDRIDIVSVSADDEGRISSETVTVGQISERVVARKKATALATEVEIPTKAGDTPRQSPAIKPRPAFKGRRTRHLPIPDEEMPVLVPSAGWTEEGEADGLNASQFVYRPMWFVERKVISAHLSVPARVGEDGTMLFGGAAMPASRASSENAALDGLTLRRVIDDLRRIDADKRQLILVAPVHFITLADPRTRSLFTTLCGTMPEQLRRLAVFELIGLPRGVTSAALLKALSLLKPFGRAVLVRHRLDTKDFSHLRGLGVFAVGVDVGNLPLRELTMIRYLDRFKQAAGLHDLSTYVHGLSSISLISSAVGAGFDYIAGDPVMSVIETPESIFPFDLENLYQPLLKSTT